MDSTKSGKIFVILVLLLFTSGSEATKGLKTRECTKQFTFFNCTVSICSNSCKEFITGSDGRCIDNNDACQCYWSCLTVPTY
ncbi:hypothetical protein K1719_034847 [Acacia pycnantha]|nr:hypothetical protein K1719_034847 [Acacia pycnantha]